MRTILLSLLLLSAAALEVTEAQFAERDRDGDGRVTTDELPAQKLFERLDENGDGVITRSEVGLAADDATPLVLAPSVIPANRAALIGRRLPALSLVDLDGDAVDPLALEAPAVALVIRDPACPVAAKLAPDLARTAADLAQRGVPTIYLHIGDEPAGAVADLAAHGFVGRYCNDAGAGAAAALQATTTTEVFLIDATGTLRYRGALNDRYGVGWSQGEARYRFLEDAVDAVLAGREPAVVATAAPGCSLDLRPTATDGAITWHNRVARILDRNCVECHRTDGPGPFPLETYAQASGRRKGMIADVVAEGLMPPWFADPAHGEWANDRRLSLDDRRDLLAWIEGGCPEGDPADGAEAMARPDGWRIGEPDLVIEIPQAIDVPAEGVIPYVNLSVRNPERRDRWIEAYEIRPTAPQVVHHVLVFLDDGAERSGGGLRGFFAGMVPGQSALTWPPGFAKRLPAGATLRFQLHYTTGGTPATDRTRIGFRFADEAPRHEIVTRSAATTRFAIPPGVAAFPVAARYRFTRETVLLAFMPHMHLRGSAYRYQLVDPEGTVTTLLDIPAYDFDWQLRYQLAAPIRVAPGSELRTVGVFDNSEGNWANPDPTATVTYGEQTWDEMQIGYWEGYER